MHEPRLIGLLIATTLTGCATADFTPYTGAQQKWPTAPGAFVQVVEAGHGPMAEGGAYKLPVYFGPPNRPYRVIGSIDAESGNLATWQSGNPARSRVSGQRSEKLRSTAQTPSLCLVRMWRRADTARRL